VACPTPNCDRCNAGNPPTTCQRCLNGYFRTNNGSCAGLPNCATAAHIDPISGIIVVDACGAGCYPNATTNATACLFCNKTVSGCAGCQLGPGGVYCNFCNQGQGFVNNPQQCSSCSYSCSQCLPYYYQSKAGCLTCPAGYKLRNPPNADRRCYNPNGAHTLLPSVIVVALMALVTLFGF